MALLWDCTPNGTFTTASFTSGIRSAMNTAKWSTTITHTNAFNTYSGFIALVANGNGGLWIVNGQVELYRDEDGGQVCSSGSITNSAGGTVTITVDPVARTLQVSGATSGNGTVNWVAGTTTLFSTGSVGVGQYAGGGFTFAGTVGDIQDFVTALSGDAAITLGAAAAAATGSIELLGDGTITLGVLDAQGADVPTGNATITLGALSEAGTGTIELIGDAAVTLGAASLASTATGPSAWAVGASTFAQRNNNVGASTGTLTTTGISTTTGSILIASIARGKWDTAGVPSPKGPTDSQGNTWTAISPGDQGYSGYPDSRVGLWWCINTSGNAAHTFSAAWGPYGTGAPGNPGDEVTIAIVELLSNGELTMIDSSTHVERATPIATTTGTAVTPTGPSITVAFVEGNGPVGQTHVFTATAGSTAAGWANVPGATFTADTSTDGYIQVSPWVLIDQAGTKTGAAQNIGVTGTSSEGAQVFQFVFQTAAGVLAVGGPTLGAVTVAGDGVFPAIGDSAIALGAAALSATGAIDVSGAADVVLAAIAIAATSEVDVAGGGAIALGAITLGSTSEIDVAGAAAVQLGAVAVAGASDTTPLDGAAAIALGSLGITGQGFGAPLTADASITFGALTSSGSGSDVADEPASLQGNIMPTTAATIRDHIIRLITELVPSVLERDRFKPYRNELAADFADAAEASPQCFRWFQVRDTGRFGSPLVSNTDVTARYVTFEILVAYPQTHRTGPQNALDRDDAMDADELELEQTFGMHGYQNFNGIAGPQASWVESNIARAKGTGVDFLVISQTMRYHRLQ